MWLSLNCIHEYSYTNLISENEEFFPFVSSNFTFLNTFFGNEALPPWGFSVLLESLYLKDQKYYAVHLPLVLNLLKSPLRF